MVRPSIPHDVMEIAQSVMEGLACPRSLAVAIMLRHGEWEQILGLSVDPAHYNNSESVWTAMQATYLLKKNVDMPGTSPALRKEKAIKQFFLNESACFRTNQRLNDYVYDYNLTHPSERKLLKVIGSVRKVVQQILGDSPPSNWEGRFGPGATMSDKATETCVPDKMSSVPTLTSDAWPFLFPWTGTLWAKAVAASGAGEVRFIGGNSFFTVPKDAITERGCAKEPSINSFYQLGLGRVMKQLLRSWGLDLKTGQDVHRRVACSASKSGRFATIDLSQASDTMSSTLVRLLVPPRWFEVLNALRSPTTNVDGKTVWLEKFSSMGNGFTFELETVLFAAITHVMCQEQTVPGYDLFVYGDDIIMPTEYSRDVISALSFFGFQVNKAKSFVEGSFRESCGGDFYNGVAVRPFKLEEMPYEPQHYVSLANGLRRSASSDAGRRDSRMRELLRAWFKVLDQIPVTVRGCRGPEDLGDLVIHDDKERWDTRWRSNGIRYLRVYRPARYKRVRWDGFGYDVQFAAAIYGVRRRKFPGARAPFLAGGGATELDISTDVDVSNRLLPTFCTGGSEGDLVPRDGVAGYKVGWVAYS